MGAVLDAIPGARLLGRDSPQHGKSGEAPVHAAAPKTTGARLRPPNPPSAFRRSRGDGEQNRANRIGESTSTAHVHRRVKKWRRQVRKVVPHIAVPRRGGSSTRRSHPRTPQLRRMGAVLAGRPARAFRELHQLAHQVRGDLSSSRPGMESCHGDRRGPGRPGAESQAGAGLGIGVHASISVARELLAADVTDELRLVIAPSIAGRGRRLLDGLPPIRLESIRSETSPSSSLIVAYRVVPQGSQVSS
jgi:hypothetical protein